MAKKKYRATPALYGFRIYAISTLLFLFLVFPITGILLVKHGPDLQKLRTGNYYFNKTDSSTVTPDTNELTYHSDSLSETEAITSEAEAALTFTETDSTGTEESAVPDPADEEQPSAGFPYVLPSIERSLPEIPKCCSEGGLRDSCGLSESLHPDVACAPVSHDGRETGGNYREVSLSRGSCVLYP